MCVCVCVVIFMCITVYILCRLVRSMFAFIILYSPYVYFPLNLFVLITCLYTYTHSHTRAPKKLHALAFIIILYTPLGNNYYFPHPRNFSLLGLPAPTHDLIERRVFTFL